jgi:hypothetical protein
MRTLLSLFALVLAAPSASADVRVWSQGADNFDKIPSWTSTAPLQDIEAADDFDVVGTIRRVRILGGPCFACAPPDVLGVRIRFWAWDDGEVGALLWEHDVSAADPGLSFETLETTVLDVTLPEPFHATGRHFLSAQIDVAGGSTWYWKSAGDGQVAFSALRWRDNLAGGAFAPYVSTIGSLQSDLAFELWGEGVAAPTGVPELVWAQYADFLAPAIPGSVWPGATAQPELADDLDFTGAIHRLTLSTQSCFGCPYPTETGARVRFYAWTAGGPGALLHDVTVPAGPGGADFQGLLTVIPLSEPFLATGRHFVSVQLLATGPNGYEWRASGTTPAALGAAFYRDEAQTTAWGPWIDGGVPFGGDMAIQIQGIPAPASPPVPVGDPCGPWKAFDVPHAANVSHSILRDVKVFAEDDVWAVGTRQLVVGPAPSDLEAHTVSLHFDGAQWSEVPTPSPEPYAGASGAGLWAVDGVAPDDLWAAGSQELQGSGGFIGTQTLVMRWDGSSWTVVDSPITPGVPGTLQGTSGGFVRDIEAIAADDVWFVGDWNLPFACRMSLAMHWDGNDFTVHDTPCDGLPGANEGFGLESVSAVSSDDVWAVGGGGDGDSIIYNYVIHWDGTAWSHVETPEPGFVHRLFAVEAIASDDVWAVGQFLDAFGYHAFAIHWDGTAWNQVDTPGGSLGLWAAASDEVYAVGGGVFRWDGAGWSFADDVGELSGEHLSVSFSAIDGEPGCVLHAVGRHNPLGLILPFSARPNLAAWWNAEERLGCTAGTVNGGLALLEPPVLGGTCRVALDDPGAGAGLTPGATGATWVVSTSPGPGYPCGLAVAGLGSADMAAGEALVGLDAGWFLVHAAGTWSGPGVPLVIDVPMPGDPALSGVQVYTQGVLFDGAGPAGAVLTNALDLRLGS